jgi:hypothetical protein
MAPEADSACTSWRQGPVIGQNAITIHRRNIGATVARGARWISAEKRPRSTRDIVAARLIADPSGNAC